jgi:hypothetical protein
MSETYSHSTPVSRWRADGCHSGTSIANLTFDHWSGLYLLCFSVDAGMLTYVKHLWKWAIESGLWLRQEQETFLWWTASRSSVGNRFPSITCCNEFCPVLWNDSFFVLPLFCLILSQKVSYVLHAEHTESQPKTPTTMQRWQS